MNHSSLLQEAFISILDSDYTIKVQADDGHCQVDAEDVIDDIDDVDQRKVLNCTESKSFNHKIKTS